MFWERHAQWYLLRAGFYKMFLPYIFNLFMVRYKLRQIAA